MDEQKQQGNKEPRISSSTAFLMIFTAGVFDLISVIPIVGQALAMVGSAVIFFIWFKIRGVSFVSPKKLATSFVSYVGEAIPAVSALPLITVGVIITIALTKAEDKTGLTLPKTLKAGDLSGAKNIVSETRKTLPETFQGYEPQLEQTQQRMRRAKDLLSVGAPPQQMNDMLPSSKPL